MHGKALSVKYMSTALTQEISRTYSRDVTTAITLMSLTGRECGRRQPCLKEHTILQVTRTKRQKYPQSGQGSSVTIRYEGTGFLYHMVRILTGTLLETGTYQRTVESVAGVLQAEDRGQAGFLAPARGLFLREVYYDQRGR